MMKGLMGWCLKHEATLERVWTKAEQTDDELNPELENKNGEKV